MTLLARLLLRTRIVEHGGFAAVAGELGCTREYLYTLATGTQGKLPSIQLAARIEATLGVPMAAWAINGAAA